MIPADDRIRTEHGWCLQLKTSQAFRYYLDELEKRFKIAMRETCAASPTAERAYHAGQLAALTEASTLIEKRYKELAKQVEVIES